MNDPMRTAGEVRRRCPRCGRFLAPEERGPLGHLEIQSCADCEWFWLEKGQLDALDESVWIDGEQLDYRRVESGSPLRCPACSEVMVLLAVPGSEETLLRCPGCHGFWLDEGGLEAVRKAAFAALDATLDTVETVGEVSKEKPDIIAQAKRHYSPDAVDRILAWLRRRLGM